MHTALQVLHETTNQLIAAGVPVPDGAPAVPPGKIGKTVATFIGWVKWGAIAAAVISLAFIGAKVALTRSGRTSGTGSAIAEIPYPVFGVIIALSAAAIVSLVAK